MAELILIDGSNRETRHPLKTGETIIGRNPAECTVTLHSPGVSRKHACIAQRDKAYTIRDLGSVNGVLLNGEILRAEKTLQHGDRIQLGDAKLMFHHVVDVPVVSPELADRFGTRTISFIDVLQRMGEAEGTTLEEKLRGLVRACRHLMEITEPDEVVVRCLEVTLEILPGVRDVHVVMIDERTGEPRRTFSRQRDPSGQGRVPSRTILDECIRDKRAILCQDLSQDPQFWGSHSLLITAARQFMCCPLLTRGNRVIGAIQVIGDSLQQPFDDNDLDILVHLATMASLAMQNASHHLQAVDQKALERELDVARRIQGNFLPRHPPDVPGYDFFHHSQPARQVGGDYVDYIPLKGRGVAVVVADVSGKGVPSALYMARFSAEARVIVLTSEDPLDAMWKLNQSFFTMSEDMMSVTCAIGYLSAETHQLDLVLAGQPVPILLSGSSGEVRPTVEDPGSLPLGLFDNETMPVPYERTRLTLEPNDLLLFYSDGLTDVEREEGVFFGTDGILGSLRASQGELKDRCHTLLEEALRFGAGKAQPDDLSILALRRLA